jgi:hypothetical protein
LEDVFLLFREEDDTDQLSLCCHEVGSHHADRYTVLRTESLELCHFLLVVHLNDCGSLEHKGALVDGRLHISHAFEGVCLLHHRDGLSCECALVDKGAAFKDNAFKGNLDGILEEYDISRHHIDRGSDLDSALPQHVDWNVVVGHAEDLIVELDNLVEVDRQTERRDEEQNTCEVEIFLVPSPVGYTENKEKVKRTQDLSDSQIRTAGSFDNHSPRPIAILEFVRLAVTQSPFLLGRPNDVTNAVTVVIHTDTNNLFLVDDVGHIAVYEVHVVVTFLLVDHEHLPPLTDDAHLLVEVQNVEVSRFLQSAKLEVENSLEVWIPTLFDSYQKVSR